MSVVGEDQLTYVRLRTLIAGGTSRARAASHHISAGVGAGAGAAHLFDDRLADWAAQSGSASYTTIGDALGSGWTQVGGAPAT